MEAIFLVIVIVLIILAVSDLIVGVSNDAVNFLNSALGSKAAPFWVIMGIASVGILVGATFSSGMMEVARRGIFHPQMFSFKEIMFVFLAVMLTDIILLDLFNTFGMPTSTTVSIVFELLGSAVAISMIKIKRNPDMGYHLGHFINTDSALGIIFGILLSVVIAFTVGALIQYFVRLLFTFNYNKTLKYFGAIWGGIAISAITFFILIKGAKGSSLIPAEIADWIKTHSLYILFGSFVTWVIILQILNYAFKINILKVIILIGTFALAMAFAGNDLVNFIGVPLAGLKSFSAAKASGLSANNYTMEILAEKVHTDSFYLLIAGLVMVITLWLSRKARTVTETEINLARQDEGYERFGSTMFSRSIVRWCLAVSNSMKIIVPNEISTKIQKRFERPERKKNTETNQKDTASFDLVRASVNLVVASILISIATSIKLPLSTTYVTFMVAMGTSLSDKAWGRESAVYRITGVLSVIGGWFLTALIAFTVAFIFANIISYTETIGIIVLVIMVAFIAIRSHLLHRKREARKLKNKESEIIEVQSEKSVLEECNTAIITILKPFPGIYRKTMNGLFEEDRKRLKAAKKEIKALNNNTKELKDNIYGTLKKLRDDSVDTGHYYVQAIDYLREIVNCLTYITQPSFEHIENNHNGLLPTQKEEIREINDNLNNLFLTIQRSLTEQAYDELSTIINMQESLLDTINTCRKKQIKRVKKENAGTRTTLLYLNILAETKNMLLYTAHLVKAQREFIKASDKNMATVL